MMFKQAEFIRSRTILALESIPEEIADTMPAGFNNNIRWHVGHIFTVQEQLTFYFAKEPLNLPENFKEWFANKTKPADWKEAPPALETLKGLLAEQTFRIKQVFGGRLDEKVPKPFILGDGIQLETIGELLNFTLYHEGVHLGFINALKRAITGRV